MNLKYKNCPISSALSSNSYNYITSTYFLLAEKHLRDQQTRLTVNPSLTSSLESLHDKRKNSGAGTESDTNSDTEDTLAPLDLETGTLTGKKQKFGRAEAIVEEGAEEG
jgi:hypothetical protein